MIEEARLVCNDARSKYQSETKKIVDLEKELKEAKNKKRKNYFKFWAVAKAMIKMFFKQPTSEEVSEAIKPANDYQKAIETISVLEEKIKNAEIDQRIATNEYSSTNKFLELLCTLRGYAVTVKTQPTSENKE